APGIRNEKTPAPEPGARSPRTLFRVRLSLDSFFRWYALKNARVPPANVRARLRRGSKSINFSGRSQTAPTMVTNLGSTMDALRCSFCNKQQNEVGKLIAGPSVFICDECIAVCNDIIADDIVELQELKRRERTYRPEVGKENPAGIVPGLPLGLSLQCSLC